MKRIVLILVLFCTTIAQIQGQTFEDEVKRISKKIDRITNQQNTRELGVISDWCKGAFFLLGLHR